MVADWLELSQCNVGDASSFLGTLSKSLTRNCSVS